MERRAIAPEPRFGAGTERMRPAIQRHGVLELHIVLAELDRVPELDAESWDLVDTDRWRVRRDVLSVSVLSEIPERQFVERAVRDDGRVRDIEQLIAERV